MANRRVNFQDLGLIDYLQAWEHQKKLFEKVVEQKIRNRSLTVAEATSNFLIFCEHRPVFTLGKSGDPGHLLLDRPGLEARGATFYHINRGGDITFHGPGQIVGYPILDLENFFTDIHLYLRTLEEAVIQTLAEYQIDAGRIDGLTGVWLDYQQTAGAFPRKICALGVKTSRWVTMHGFAFNVNTDLSYFDHIVPCGIRDKAVTSLAAELGNPVNMEKVAQKLRSHIAREFQMDLDL
ncbi:MAG: octanoyltransferase [Cyclobacteriaceae bacterium]|nr:MAG: octanoyltransferase [Cyclobacteriaceae bacterium]